MTCEERHFRSAKAVVHLGVHGSIGSRPFSAFSECTARLSGNPLRSSFVSSHGAFRNTFPHQGCFTLQSCRTSPRFRSYIKEANGRLLPRDPFSRMERVPTEKQATADLDIRRRGPWRNLEAVEFATLSGTSPARADRNHSTGGVRRSLLSASRRSCHSGGSQLTKAPENPGRFKEQSWVTREARTKARENIRRRPSKLPRKNDKRREKRRISKFPLLSARCPY